jgi:superfamily I DNA and/or RNA helicase
VALTDKTKKLLITYLRRLTNLSGNNRSLFLARLTADQFIDVQELSQFNGEPAFSIINALIREKPKFICPVLDSRMEAANEASRKLKKLQRIDQFIYEERGSKDLHVGWPIVQGKLKDDTLVRCPLLFFPVSLTIQNNQWWLEPREDAGITFNKSFLLAYAHYNQVKPTEALLDETFEEIDRDSTAFRTVIYQLLQKNELEINFNSDNFRDELTPFVNIKRDAFEEGLKTGELKLFPKAVLGIFPQAGSFLVPDYLHLIENEQVSDLESFFESRSTSYPESKNFITQVKEEKIYTCFPADIWQENSVKAVKLGHSLVVQGPPGTGKSQLICNLIGDALATGKRVLVVCQKRAALDVVYQRLQSKQLTDFAALVHDFKNDRKEIYEKIARQINRLDEYKTRNVSIDAIQLDRKFLQISHRIDQITEELEKFKHALFDEKTCGTTIKELYLQSNPAQESINLKQEFSHFRYDTLTPFLHKLTTYSHYAQTLKRSDYPWKDRKSFSAWQASDETAIRKTIADVNQHFQLLTTTLFNKLGIRLDWEQCELLLEKKTLIDEIKSLLTNDSIYRYFQSMISETDEETSALWLSNIEKNTMSCFENEGPEIFTPGHQLGNLQKALYRSMKARRSLIGLVRWELFSKDKFLIKRVLVQNELTSSKPGFATLEQRLDNRLNLEHNLSKLKGKVWLKQVPESFSQKEFIQWFADQHFALQAKLVFAQVRGLKHIIDPTGISRQEFTTRLTTLYDLLSEILPKKENWTTYLTSSQVNSITTQPWFSQHLQESLKEDFDSLCEFDKLIEGLNTVEKQVLNKLFELHPAWDEYQMKSLFLNSLALTWIDHLEIRSPELRMVSSGKISLLENELRDLITEKQNLCEEIILLRAREKTIEDLKVNRLNNRVSYRDLLHQVTKKKKIWPVRKVVASFTEELFKVIPCWLASPESVSAIFPMEDFFDLVIFDEASQCFAERGIPALYRGKQAIVAGDAMQLKPGDFYHARWQDEDETHADAEVDSLLDLCNRYLISTVLHGHYRSKTLELIDFSNRHFYNGTLQLLPHKQAMLSTEHAIVYDRVAGVWQNNSNVVEAIRIVEHVTTTLKNKPDKSIGIITFNAPQQNLILDLLEEELGSIPKSIFVKNIENVQGDECDIVLFSIGYAPDKQNRIPAQFGSLNLAGGENRLNVAVSRAREKIIVVCSFLPEQLQVEETLHTGPKLLKAYLQYAWKVSNGEFTTEVLQAASKNNFMRLKQEIKKRAEQKWPEFNFQQHAIPFHDLTVNKKSQAYGAILTDDGNYYTSMSARADHALTPQLLDAKAWPFIRVYSRNFWQDPDKFLNEIGKFINS